MQYFSIALLLFSLISSAMNKFLRALKKRSFGRVASYACTESFISVSLAKWWNLKASLSEPRGGR